MIEYDFIVPGDPIPKSRPRVYSSRNGKTHAINEARTVEAENRILQEFVRKYGCVKPICGTVSISCIFYMATRKRKDFDNLVKLVTDALNGVAYVDDSQIIHAIIAKIMPVEGRETKPKTIIHIEEVEENTIHGEYKND